MSQKSTYNTCVISTPRPGTTIAVVDDITFVVQQSGPEAVRVDHPPLPGDCVFTLPTDASGELNLGGTWPAGLPSGFKIYYQAWQQDPGGPLGFAASNGLLSTTP